MPFMGPDILWRFQRTRIRAWVVLMAAGKLTNPVWWIGGDDDESAEARMTLRAPPVRWSRAPSNRGEPARSDDVTSGDGEGPLELDLSPSSSSMRVAIPAPSERGLKSAITEPSKTERGESTAPVPPPLAEHQQASEVDTSGAPRHTDASKEPRLEDLDAGFDALLDGADR
jgi:hypothetical protein